MIVGRFAPSPTGPLHIGSLMAAVASYLEVKTQGGKWLVRIEDIDTPRQVPSATQDILHTLQSHGMQWDAEVVYQSQRHALYQEALDKLDAQALLYACNCSRKQIAQAPNVFMGVDGLVYPKTCRDKSLSFAHNAIRIKVPEQVYAFNDGIQGPISQQLAKQCGDFVLRRADGIYSYQLAVVVDDALQGITHITRGSDLLDSTPRQCYLQQCLGYPTPQYSHIPVITNSEGEKLSKQTLAPALQVGYARQNLILAMQYLGHSAPASLHTATLADFWQWALQNWDSRKIAQQRKILPT